jgi:TolB-like protein
MKRIICVIILFAVALTMLFAQNADLPRLAVVEFSTNDNTAQIKRDAITVRNLVESQMVGTRKYQIITRDDIDKLLANQQIQVSSISSAENLKKLQLQNISYIVTGSVDAMDSDYAITVRVLDVSTGQFSHSDNAFMGSAGRDLYNGINGLMAKFVSGMSATAGGAIVQGNVVAPSGISIEVKTDKGGDLYFQGEKIATLWDNDTHTIPIERPGTYSLRMLFINNDEK